MHNSPLGKMRAVIRGFAEGKKQFEDTIDAEEEDFAGLVVKHAKIMSKFPLHYIEFEFLDRPESERFFRFGTDPSQMVIPIEVNLKEEKPN